MTILRQDTAIRPRMSVWLDAMRGLAAVGVVLEHLYDSIYAETPSGLTGALRLANSLFARSAAYSHEAVIVFFVLSGYLVGGPSSIRFLRGSASATDYLAARLSRMYTVLVPALVLTAILMGAALSSPGSATFFASRGEFFPPSYDVPGSLSPVSAVCNLAFLQTIACLPYGGNLSLWSVSNEFIYYMVFLTVALAGRSRLFLVGTAALTLTMLSPELTARPGEHPGWTYVAYLLIWSLGTAAFVLRKTRMAVAAAGGLALGLLAGLAHVRSVLPHSHPVHDVILGLLIASILLVLEGADIRPFLLPRRLVKWLAEISFSLYAIHLPVIVATLVAAGGAAYAASWTSLLIAAGMFCEVLVVAWLFHAVSERHTPAVRRWMLRVLGRVPAPAPAGGAASRGAR